MWTQSPKSGIHTKHDQYEYRLRADEAFVANSSFAKLLARIVLMLLFVIAILLRSLA